MVNENTNYAIKPPPPPKKTISVLNGGAHRGARENLAAFADFNASSATIAITPVYTDPLPGRAIALKEEAAQRGIVAGAIQEKVGTIVKAVAGASHEPIVLNIDRASGVAEVLRETRGIERPILGYLLVKTPNGQLLGLRFVLEPNDNAAKEAAIAFFETLALVSERNASSAILGEQADPAHLLLEPVIRKWFAEHTKQNLAKVLANLEPESNVFEVTTDGNETQPLFVAVRRAWAEPGVLAEEIIRHPAFPIRKGVRFVIAEVFPGEGIRFHDVRRRSDDRITIGGVEIVDHATVEAARREEIRRQEARARERAARETLSRVNPIWTTD